MARATAVWGIDAGRQRAMATTETALMGVSGGSSASKVRRQLLAAARSGNRAETDLAFPLVFKTDPSDPEGADCLLDFFACVAAFSPHVPDDVLVGLQHLSDGAALDGDQKKRLSSVYGALASGALRARSAAAAAAFALAGYRNPALNETDRTGILAGLVERGCGQPDVLDRARQAAPSDPDLTFLLALTQFRLGRYQQAVDTLAGADESGDLPSARLREAARAAHWFCGVDDGAVAPDKPTRRRWLQAFRQSQPTDRVLGPAIQYVRGRLLAMAGHLSAACDLFGQAARACPDPLYEYYAVHALQLLGRDADAGRLLQDVGDAVELGCLRLRQLLRDRGPVPEDEALAAAGHERPSDVLRAKYAVLTGRGASQPPVDQAVTRGHAEEALRVALALALGRRDPAAAAALTRHSLFASLPRAEKATFKGVVLWLRGRTSRARSLLTLALDEMPGCTGALKCLADTHLAEGDPRRAIQPLRQVFTLSPGDVVSHFRLVRAYRDAGRHRDASLLIETIRKTCDPSGQDAALVGRVLLHEAFQRIAAAAEAARDQTSRQAQAGSPRTDDPWPSVGDLAADAATAFAKADDAGSVRWWRWLCHVLAASPPTWPTKARRLLTIRPKGTPDASPPEARWIEALLKVLSGQAAMASEGLETLLDLTTAAGHDDVTRAFWWVARLATPPAEQPRLRRLWGRFLQAGAHATDSLVPLRADVAVRVLAGADSPEDALRLLDDAGLSRDHRALARRVLLVLQDRQAEARELHGERSAGAADVAPWIGLAEGLAALGRGDLQALRDVRRRRERPQTAARWQALEAAALVRLGEAAALKAVVAVLRRASTADRTAGLLPLPGLLAYVACESAGAAKPEGAAALRSLTRDDLATDPGAPVAYLQAAILLGADTDAVETLQQDPVLLAQASQDLVKMNCHLAVRALADGQHETASRLLAKAKQWSVP